MPAQEYVLKLKLYKEYGCAFSIVSLLFSVLMNNCYTLRKTNYKEECLLTYLYNMLNNCLVDSSVLAQIRDGAIQQ